MKIKDWKKITNVFSGIILLIIPKEAYRIVEYDYSMTDFDDCTIKEVNIDFDGKVRIFIQ